MCIFSDELDCMIHHSCVKCIYLGARGSCKHTDGACGYSRGRCRWVWKGETS